MVKHFSEINTVGITWEAAMTVALEAERTRKFNSEINRVTVGLSSGTSGKRGVFLISYAELLEYAGRLLSIFPPSFLLKRHRIAFFLRSNNNIYQTTGGTFFKFHFFDLLLPLEIHLDALQNFSPTLLMGPPSLLCMIAKAVQMKKIKIFPLEVFSVAEKLDEHDKNYLESVFGVIIKQLYQATEGFLGASCQYGVIHLNEDSILFEKEAIPNYPRAFHPIITDLKRRSQPFLRYRLDDILVEREIPCHCNSPMLAIERIEGRSDDVFYVKTKSGSLEVIFPDFVTREVLSSSEKIQDFRATQVSFKDIHLQILCSFGSENEIICNLEKKFFELFAFYDAETPTLFIQWQIDDLGIDKLRRVKRSFNIDL